MINNYKINYVNMKKIPKNKFFVLGGIPEYLNTEYNYPGLVGCIEQVEFKGERSLNLGRVAVAGRNTQPCKK